MPIYEFTNDTNKLMKKRIFLATAAGLLIFAAAAPLSHASAQQTSEEVMLTWRAETYVPADYAGRVLPARGASVTASVELLDNGRLVDLSGKKINWIVDRQILGSGIGLKTFTFTIPDFASERVRLVARITKSRGVSLEKSADLPVKKPEAVIDIPYPSRTAKERDIRLYALPYFFPIKSLEEISFLWRANDDRSSSPTGLDNELLISVPEAVAQTTGFFIDLMVSSPQDNFLVGADASAQVIFEPK